MQEANDDRAPLFDQDTQSGSTTSCNRRRYSGSAARRHANLITQLVRVPLVHRLGCEQKGVVSHLMVTIDVGVAVGCHLPFSTSTLPSLYQGSLNYIVTAAAQRVCKQRFLSIDAGEAAGP